MSGHGEEGHGYDVWCLECIGNSDQIVALRAEVRALKRAHKNIARLLRFSHKYMRPHQGFERSEDAVDRAMEIAEENR